MKRRDWYCEEVLAGNLEVKVVWEDGNVLAFHHPRSQAEVHVVVIPKRHVESLLDPLALDGKLLSSMMRAVQEIVLLMELDGKGFTVQTNGGSDGVTPHMHWHIKGPGIP